MEEFDKNNILKTIVNDDGDEVIDWDQNPTIVKFEDIGAWLAYKESREEGGDAIQSRFRLNIMAV